MSDIIITNVGSAPNDGTGDALRKFAQDTNTNMAELNAKKVEVVAGKQLSTNDYTNADKAIVTATTANLALKQNLSEKQNAMTFDGTGNLYPTVDAVNVLTNAICQAVVNTGFINKQDPFILYSASTTHLGISGSTGGVAFSGLFFNPPFAPSTGIVNISSRTVPLSDIGFTGTGTTQAVKYVGYRESDDSIVFSNTTFIQSPTVCQLGIVFAKYSGGVTTFLDSARNVITVPDISQYSNLETTSIGLQTNVLVDHLATDLRLKNTSGSLIGISVNWHGTNNDLKPIASSDSGGTQFIYIHPGLLNSIAPLSATTLVDPTRYWNGTALVDLAGANNASVQRITVTLAGRINVQYGENQYTDFNEALANVYTQTFQNITPEGTFVEIARLVMKKSCTNLADVTSAEFVATIGNNGGGGGESGGGSTLWGGISGNILDQTDLQTSLATKFGGTLTLNKIPKYIGSGQNLGDSNLFDNGTVVSATTDMSINGLTVGRGNGNNITNAIFGVDAFKNNATGTNNIAIGTSALTRSVNTNFNIALGYAASSGKTSGDYVVALGNEALSNLTASSQNIGIGYRAGAFLANGTTPNTSATNSIYLGILSRASSVGNTNEIVIGSNNTGGGSNSVTLGNSSITKTLLKGTVGITTIDPTYQLQVDPTTIVNGGVNNLLKLSVTSVTNNTKARLAFAISSNPNDDAGGGKIFIDGVRTVNNMELAFSLNDVALTAPVERMRLNGAGALLVGTTASTTSGKLEVVSSAATDQTILYQNLQSSGVTGIVAKDNGGTKFLTVGICNTTVNLPSPTYGLAGEGVVRASTSANGLYLIAVNGAVRIAQGLSGTERMRVSSNGNILLGTTADTTSSDGVVDKLTISGSLNATGRIKTTGGGDPDTGTTNATISVSGGAPRLSLVNTSNASGQRVADILNGTNSGLGFRFRNDNSNASTFSYLIQGAYQNVTGHTWYLGNQVINMTLNSVGLNLGTSGNFVSAKLQVDSTTQGFLPPRMTQAQRLAIVSPSVGLMVYQTDGTEGVYVNSSTGWKALAWV